VRYRGRPSPGAQVSHLLPTLLLRQLHSPVFWSQATLSGPTPDVDEVPVLSQSHGWQPSTWSIVRLYVLLRHLLHDLPSTFDLHGHWPLILLHLTPVDAVPTVPASWHAQLVHPVCGFEPSLKHKPSSEMDSDGNSQRPIDQNEWRSATDPLPSTNHVSGTVYRRQFATQHYQLLFFI